MDESQNILGGFTQTRDGGYALVERYILVSDLAYTWFIKVDSSGNVQWNKTLDGVNHSIAGLFQTGDDGYVIIGHKTQRGSGPTEIAISMIDSIGNVQWQKLYGGNLGGHSARVNYALSEESEYLIAGLFYAESDARIGWLAKTDSQGVMLWNQTYDQAGPIESIAPTSDGGFVLSGAQFEPANNSNAAFVMKVGSFGNPQGRLKIGSTTAFRDSIARSVIETIDGGFIFTGHWNQTDLVPQDTDRIWLAKISPIQDVSSPEVSILSPENKTITVKDVALTYIVNEPATEISYSLDGHANVPINGNTTLTNLTEGLHTVAVFSVDDFGNTGIATAAFTVETFPIMIIAVVIVIVVIVNIGLLFYFRKHRQR